MADSYNSTFCRPPTAATNTAISNVSTAAVTIGVRGFVRFVAVGVDVYVLFGASDVAAATTSNALAIPAGSYMDFYCGDPAVTHFRAICAAGSGSLSWAYTGG